MSEFLRDSIWITILTAFLGTAVTLLLRRKDSDKTNESATAAAIKKDHDELVAKVEELQKELLVLKTQVSPLWAVVQSTIVRELTHPSPQFHEMDELMHKLEALTIEPGERFRLMVMLDERITSNDPEVTDSEKDSAQILKLVMRKVSQERERERATQNQ